MEKELNCPPLMAMEITSENLQTNYFSSNWDTPIDQNDPFESALSSMVSSPTTNNAPSNLVVGDGLMIRELIGRLGSICDSNGEISPQSCIANSTNTSCYSTPLNSPPKINLSHINTSNMLMGGHHGNFPTHPPNLGSFNPDPGFVERAAKFSCFGNNHNHNNNFVGNLSMRENGEMGDSREGSSVSEQNPGGEMGIKAQNEAANSRKRKSIPKAKVKDCPSPPAPKHKKAEAENEESKAKRSKADEEEAKQENAGQNGGDLNNNNNNKDKQNNNKEATKPEPPKDYIHVRARRGQATDSHSLAERVRREKISERMKFLQDLVPGCNKVTGKATVLDEIINYVQSLQRQVEFLSMKLATVNPRMEFNMEALLSKDMFQSRGSSMPQTMFPIDQNSAQVFPFGYHQSSQQLPSSLPNGLPNGTENPFSLNALNAAGIRQNSSIQVPSIDRFSDSISQLPNFWEDDLHSIVQMGIAQNPTQIGHGALPNGQMKVEL